MKENTNICKVSKGKSVENRWFFGLVLYDAEKNGIFSISLSAP